MVVMIIMITIRFGDSFQQFLKRSLDRNLLAADAGGHTALRDTQRPIVNDRDNRDAASRDGEINSTVLIEIACGDQRWRIEDRQAHLLVETAVAVAKQERYGPRVETG